MTGKNQYTYTIILEPDTEDGGYVVYAPALKGCHTYGKTRQEALAMIQEAIALYVETLMDANESIPPDIEALKIVA